MKEDCRKDVDFMEGSVERRVEYEVRLKGGVLRV